MNKFMNWKGICKKNKNECFNGQLCKNNAKKFFYCEQTLFSTDYTGTSTNNS